VTEEDNLLRWHVKSPCCCWGGHSERSQVSRRCATALPSSACPVQQQCVCACLRACLPRRWDSHFPMKLNMVVTAGG